MESPTENAGLSQTATDAAAAVTRNVALEAGDTPGANPASDAWKWEPIGNFVTDARGNLVMKADGAPKRRFPGRRRKPAQGDRLAGGWTCGVDEPPRPPGVEAPRPRAASKIVDPGPPEVEPGAEVSDEPSPAGGVELGPEAGKVLAQTTFNLAEVAGGAKAKPTDGEREAIENSASAPLGHWRLSPLIALGVFVGAYVLRVFLARKAERHRNSGNADAHPDRGPDALRQVPAGPAPVWTYPGAG